MYQHLRKHYDLAYRYLNLLWFGFISNRLIFFGGYGYLPEDKVLGTFEFDETSFWVSEVLYCL